MNRLDLSDNADRIFSKILRRQAQDNGDQQFLITDDDQITFAEAERLTNQLAGGLAALGIGPGSRVALFMSSRIETVLLSLAVNKLRAIWTPINGEFRGDWLLDNLQRCRCDLLVTDETLEDRIVPILPDLGALQLIRVGPDSAALLPSFVPYDQLLQADPIVVDEAQMDYGDTCAILWTSGTTGQSKGVMQSYNAWVRPIVDGASKQYDSQPGDRIYSVLPLYNSGAWITAIYRSMIEGIPCILEQKFSVTTFWDRIRHFQATQTFAIGAMGVFLMNSPESDDDANTPLTKAQVVPLPPQHWPEFERRFNVKLIRTGFGMSECMLILTQLEDRADVPVYAIGFAPEGVYVRLLDDEGNEVPVGESGEICVRGDDPHTVFNGYFDNPEATQAAFFGDWFRTGDLGRQDPDTGAYFFMDRKKDAVRFAGRNISTLEVESVVSRHPAVQMSAAFGIPSAEVESEDELKINVVLKPAAEVTAEELCGFINDNAPHYFVPRYLEFVDSVPMTPTNKVQKYVLRDAGVSESTWDLKASAYKVRK